MGYYPRYLKVVHSQGKEKIKIIQVQSLDELEDTQKWVQF
jgi:hypothetical protein